MSDAGRKLQAAAAALSLAALAGATLAAQRGTGSAAAPTNDLPNPYQSIENALKLPDNRT